MLSDARRVGGYGPEEVVSDARDLASRIFVTVYMGTENSSAETKERAKTLAAEIGSWHLAVGIDPLVSALTSLFSLTFGRCVARHGAGTDFLLRDGQQMDMPGGQVPHHPFSSDGSW